jgi:hypothetical protein
LSLDGCFIGTQLLLLLLLSALRLLLQALHVPASSTVNMSTLILASVLIAAAWLHWLAY